MDILNGDLKKTYLKYLSASFGSALISSIYGVVDMVMVGQYHGPSGSAAMAVIAPVWNILYSFGMLAGIGGAVLLANSRGKGESVRKQNEYFTVSLMLTAFFALLLWVGLNLFEEPLLRLFGADETLLPLAERYLIPVRYTAPVFLFTQLLSAFLRNDGAPGLATKAVIAGGAINIFGDYFLVFTCDLGILGAAYATVGSATISVIVMLTHFFGKKCTLRPVRPTFVFEKLRRTISTGFPTFFVDAAMGFLTILFNRQIMRYLGQDALAVYGIIVNISTFVQCCGYGVGQASQPLLSVSYGAGKSERIRRLLRYNIITVSIISAVWLFMTFVFPEGFVRLFMSPTDSVLLIAPDIMRCYCLSFLLLPFNIYATYYFQSLMRPAPAFTVSLLRGAVLSGAFILLLPALLGGSAIWWAMPLTELLTFCFAAFMMHRTEKALH